MLDHDAWAVRRTVMRLAARSARGFDPRDSDLWVPRIRRTDGHGKCVGHGASHVDEGVPRLDANCADVASPNVPAPAAHGEKTSGVCAGCSR